MKNEKIAAIPTDLKLGVALSGGGFRASLFHIGILAKLAELGILPHVQVISAVSGGSIIAALYYKLGKLIAIATVSAIVLVMANILFELIKLRLKKFWEWARVIKSPATMVWVKIIGPIALALFVSWTVLLYLVTLDKLFNYQGRLKRLR